MSKPTKPKDTKVLAALEAGPLTAQEIGAAIGAPWAECLDALEGMLEGRQVVICGRRGAWSLWEARK